MVFRKSVAFFNTMTVVMSIISLVSMTYADEPASLASSEEGDEYSHELRRADMNDSIRALLYLTHEDAQLTDSWVDRIIKELHRLEKIADHIRYENYSSSSPISGRNLESFFADLELAKEEMNKNPRTLTDDRRTYF